MIRFGAVSRFFRFTTCALGTCLVLGEVAAAVIVVNSTADATTPGNGQCTLREAIDNANLALGGDTTAGDCAAGAPGLDTVVLPSGLYSLTNVGAGENGNARGDLDILDSIQITGAGAATTTLAGLGTDRVLDVAPNLAVVVVELVGLAVTNGNPPSGDGGGVRIASTGIGRFVDCEFVDNRALRGGGVFNNGRLLIDTSLFLTNATVPPGDNGGGVYSDGSLDVTLSTFDQNRAEGRGGGIYAENSLVVLTSTFKNNTAMGRGGGVYERADATIRDSRFEGNLSVDDDGGGLYHDGVSLSFAGNTLIDNEAGNDGGGLFAATDIDIENFEFIGNRAIRGGGAYFSTGFATAVAARFEGNSASDDGGGIHTSANLECLECTLISNTAGLDGGGLFNAGITRLVDSTVHGNESLTQQGGGIFTQIVLELEYSTVSGNTAFQRGGGIYNQLVDSQLKMRNSTVSSNAANPDGGGIFSEGILDAAFVTIADNNAASGAGGGLANTGSTAIIHTIIARNVGDCLALAPINSMGFNLDSDTTCFGIGPGDIIGTPPGLGPLQNNGGLTETHALIATSPAIDTADPACLDTMGFFVPEDQRHTTRPIDGDGDSVARCDRGAYEAPSAAPSSPPPVPNGIIGNPLTARRVEPTGAIIEVFWDVTRCPGVGYHLIYGPLEFVSSYVVTGSQCAIAPTGAVTWFPVPEGDLYFLMLADDRVNVEGTWGLSSAGVRNGAVVSGECLMTVRDNTGVCP